jgi:hypothetical protein
MEKKMWSLRKFGRINVWSILGISLGALGGYFYWREIGCATGTCPITSKPLNSVLYFAGLGYILAGMLKPKRNQAD